MNRRKTFGDYYSILDIHARSYLARSEEADALEEACEGDLSPSILVIFTSFVTRIPGVLIVESRL